MSKLLEFRKKYPEYDNLPDTQVLDGLYKNYYSDMPKEEFLNKMGVGVGLREDELMPILDDAQPVPTFSAKDAIDSGLVDESGSLDLNRGAVTPEPAAVVSSGVEDEIVPNEQKSIVDKALDALQNPIPTMFPAYKFITADEEAKDTAATLGIGATTTVLSLSDAFGADNQISQVIKGVEPYLEALLSATQKNKLEEQAKILKDAEDAGLKEQLISGLKAFQVDPGGTVTQALGSTVPFLAGIALAGVAGVGASVTATGLGLASGFGIVKRSIFDGVKNKLLETGLSEEVATRRANEAQNYVGKNFDLILAGGGLGVLASRTGLESSFIKSLANESVTKGLAKRVAANALAEGGVEALQAGEEKLAENVALRREGFENVPMFRGVAGAATFEGLAGAGAGAVGEVALRPTSEEQIRPPKEEPSFFYDQESGEIIDVDVREVPDRGGVDDVSTTDREQFDEPDTRRDRPSVPLLGRPEDATVSAVSEVAEVDPTGVGPVSSDVDESSVGDAGSYPPLGKSGNDAVTSDGRPVNEDIRLNKVVDSETGESKPFEYTSDNHITKDEQDKFNDFELTNKIEDDKIFLDLVAKDTLYPAADTAEEIVDINDSLFEDIAQLNKFLATGNPNNVLGYDQREVPESALSELEIIDRSKAIDKRIKTIDPEYDADKESNEVLDALGEAGGVFENNHMIIREGYNLLTNDAFKKSMTPKRLVEFRNDFAKVKTYLSLLTGSLRRGVQDRVAPLYKFSKQKQDFDFDVGTFSKTAEAGFMSMLELRQKPEDIRREAEDFQRVVDKFRKDYFTQPVDVATNEILDALSSSMQVGDTVEFNLTLGGDAETGTIVDVSDKTYSVRPKGAAKNVSYKLPKELVTLVKSKTKPINLANVLSSSDGMKGGKIVTIKASANTERLFQMDKAHAYASTLQSTITKETLQNSLDAIKAAQDLNIIKEGKYTVTFDALNNTITIEDNGIGMAPQTLQESLLSMAGSDKTGTKGASGGFGIAKTGIFGSAENFSVITTNTAEKKRDAKGNLVLDEDGEAILVPLAIPVRTYLIEANPLDAIGRQLPIETVVFDEGVDTYYGKDTPIKPSDTGTKIILKMPAELETAEGSGNFQQPSDAVVFDSVRVPDAFTKTFIGNVEVTVAAIKKDGTPAQDSPRIIPIGSNFPLDRFRKPIPVTFSWGKADIYIGKEKSKRSYPTHEVLSNGASQFTVDLKYDDRHMHYEVIMDIKPKHKPGLPGKLYPFNRQREAFVSSIEPDIKAMNAFILRFFVFDLMSEKRQQWSNVQVLPNTSSEASDLKTDDTITIDGKTTEIKAKPAISTTKPFDKDAKVTSTTRRAKPVDETTEDSTELEPFDPTPIRMPGAIKIDEGSVYDAGERDSSGKRRLIISKNQVRATFQSSKNAPSVDKIPDVSYENMSYNAPMFINNTNLIIKPDAPIQKLFADIGSVFLKLRDYAFENRDRFEEQDFVNYQLERLGPIGTELKSGAETINSPEKVYYVGVGIDRSYAGVNAVYPYKAMLVNPLMVLNPAISKNNVMALADTTLDTMIHEIAHVPHRNHDIGFYTLYTAIRNALVADGLLDTVMNDLVITFSKHGKEYTKLRNQFNEKDEYGSYKTFNREKSLADFAGAQAAGPTDSDKGDTGKPKKAGDLGKKSGRSKAFATVFGPRRKSKDSGRTEKSPDEVAKQQQAYAKRRRQSQATRDAIYEAINKDSDKQKPLGARTSGKAVLSKLKDAILNPRDITLPSKTRKGLYSLLTPRQLQEIVESTRVLVGDNPMPQSLGFLKSAISIVANTVPDMRLKIIKEAEPAYDFLSKLTADEVYALGKVAVKATTVNIDPATTVGAKMDPTLAAEYAALSKTAKKAYIAMRRFMELQIKGLKRDMIYVATRHMKADTEEERELLKTIVKKIEAIFKDLDKYKPFFPLTRFGAYWVQIGANEDTDKIFRVFERESEQKQYIKEYREDFVKETGQDPNSITMDTGTNFIKQILGDPKKNPSLLLQTLESAIDGILDNPKFKEGTMAGEALTDQLRKDLKERILELQHLIAPVGSLKRNMLHREKILGASTDITRVFSDFVLRVAYQRSRLRHSPDYYENLGNATREISERIAPTLSVTAPRPGAPTGVATPSLQKNILSEILDELVSRTDHLLSVRPAGLIDTAVNAVTNTAFYWYLTAPGSALVNYYGGMSIALPTIGAEFGAIRAAAKLIEHSARMMSPNLYIVKGLENDKDGIPIPMLAMNVKAPFDEYTKTLKPILQRVVTDMRTDLDTSFSYDVANLAEKPIELFQSVSQQGLRIVAALFHNSEKFARTATALAAFELAYEAKVIELEGKERFLELEKDGMTHETAYEYALGKARDMSYRSLGDYTRASKAPIFASPGGRLITQFKQYALVQTFNQLKDFKTSMGFITGMTPDSLKVELRKAGYTEEFIEKQATEYNVTVLKKEANLARKRFMLTNVMAVLVAGGVGTPFYTILTGLLVALGIVDQDIEDDDEEEMLTDVDTYLFEALERAVGKEPATILMRGLLEYAGLGVSDRLNLDPAKMWFSTPAPKDTLEDTFVETLIHNLGPGLSLVLGGLKGADLFLKEGLTFRAIEATAPAPVRSILMAFRQADEGVKVGGPTGTVLLPANDLDRLDFILRVLGVQPTKVAAAQRRKFVLNKLSRKIMRRRSILLIKHNLNLFNNRGLVEEQNILDEIEAYNRKFPGYEIGADDLSRSRNAVAKRLEESLGTMGLKKETIPFIRARQIGGEPK